MKNELRYYFEFLKDSFLKKLNQRDETPRVIPPAQKSGWAKSFDGTQIYWEIFEPAESNPTSLPPVVLCYGLVCSMNQWRKQIERYSLNRKVILFDYRGHHRSETPTESNQINISALARDLGCVLDALEIQSPVHIWGHSMGVSVAIEFAVQEPKRVKSLVLCCGSPTNPFANMFDSNLLDKAMKPLLSTYSTNSKLYDTLWSLFLAEPRMAEFVSMIAGFNAKASDKQDIQVYAKAVASVEPRVFFSLLADLSKGKTQNILAQVKAPALIIAGSHDHITPITVQKKLASMLPKAEYAEIPLGSHNVQLDFGEYVGLKAEDFWNRNFLDANETQKEFAPTKKKRATKNSSRKNELK